MSSSRRAKRSGLVSGFVASPKTSGLPSHKRRLTSWTPARNDPNRSWPNCLMSSTRSARRSALDFVGFVIVISKNPLTDRAPARRPDCVGQRAGVRALDLDRCGGAPQTRLVGGRPQKESSQIFAGFQSIPVLPGSRSVPISFLGEEAAAHQASLHHPIDTLVMRSACGFRLRRHAYWTSTAGGQSGLGGDYVRDDDSAREGTGALPCYAVLLQTAAAGRGTIYRSGDNPFQTLGRDA